MGVLYLLIATLFAWRTRSALRRPRPGRWGPMWVTALVTGELALHNLAVVAAVTGLFAWWGALGSWPGRLGLVAAAASAVGLLVAHARSYSAGAAVRAQIAGAVGEVVPARRTPVDPLGVLLVVPRVPSSVEVTSAVQYGPHPRHQLDLYLPRGGPGPFPLVVQIHGGSWMRGRRQRHGRPLMHHLAANGWACAAIDYRLSPEATFPDHLVDVKRAVAWLRAHASRYRLDPAFVATTGGSAGAHLAALAALTPNHPEYQPGFAGADTSVQACVALYGIYRLTDRNGTRGRWPFLERHVMKSTPTTQPEEWALASPIEHEHSEAPPFLVLHGTHDSLVRVGESRRFAAALLEESPSPTAYAEIWGATHGFDYFYSVRSARVAAETHRFLEAVRHRTVEYRASGEPSDQGRPPGTSG